MIAIDPMLVAECQRLKSGADVHGVNATIHKYISASETGDDIKTQRIEEELRLFVQTKKRRQLAAPTCKHPYMSKYSIPYAGRVFTGMLCDACGYQQDGPVRKVKP